MNSHSCLSCGFTLILPTFILAYRCNECKLINCLVCKRLHDMACETFKVAAENGAQAQAAHSTPQAHNPLRRLSVATTSSRLDLTGDRVYCEHCDAYYAKRGFSKHKKTKKHLENVERINADQAAQRDIVQPKMEQNESP